MALTSDPNSQFARDVALLWPLAMATLFIAGFWAFVFYVFGSGKVDLHDAVVAGLVGSSVTQAINVMMVIVLHYYEKGRHQREQSRPDA